MYPFQDKNDIIMLCNSAICEDIDLSKNIIGIFSIFGKETKIYYSFFENVLFFSMNDRVKAYNFKVNIDINFSRLKIINSVFFEGNLYLIFSCLSCEFSFVYFAIKIDFNESFNVLKQNPFYSKLGQQNEVIQKNLYYINISNFFKDIYFNEDLEGDISIFDSLSLIPNADCILALYNKVKRSYFVISEDFTLRCENQKPSNVYNIMKNKEYFNISVGIASKSRGVSIYRENFNYCKIYTCEKFIFICLSEYNEELSMYKFNQIKVKRKIYILDKNLEMVYIFDSVMGFPSNITYLGEDTFYISFYKYNIDSYTMRTENEFIKNLLLNERHYTLTIS